MRKINLLSILIILNFTGFLFAQEVSIGDLPFDKDRIFTFFDEESGQFIIESEKHEGISVINHSEPEITYYNNFVEIASGRINLNTPKGKGRILNATIYKGNIVIILYLNNNNYYRSYYQEYNRNCEPISEPVIISEYEIGNEGKTIGFSTLFSVNTKFLCIEYWQIDSHETNSNLQYVVLDLENKLSKSGGGLIPFCESPMNKFQKIITDNGDYFIGFPILQSSEEGYQTNNYSKFAIYYTLNEKFVKGEIVAFPVFRQ